MSSRIDSVRAAVAMIRARMSECELVEAVAIDAALVEITAAIDAPTHEAWHPRMMAALAAVDGLRACPKRGLYGGACGLVAATSTLVSVTHNATGERWDAAHADAGLAWVMTEIERHRVECADATRAA